MKGSIRELKAAFIQGNQNSNNALHAQHSPRALGKALPLLHGTRSKVASFF
jgi:hypothetical protein